MRTINLVIIKNNASGAFTDYLDVSSKLKQDGLGTLSWSIDDNLTKVTPGNLSFTLLEDNSNTVQTFLDTTIKDSTNLFPPWVMLQVDGVTHYMGLIDTSSITYEYMTETKITEIQIDSTDWSSMLANIPLQGSTWQRRYPRKTVGKGGVTGISGHSVAKFWLAVQYSSYSNVVYMPTATNIQVGDKLTSTLIGGTFSVLSIDAVTDPSLGGMCKRVVLNGYAWPNPGGSFFSWLGVAGQATLTDTFAINAGPTTEQPYWSVIYNYTPTDMVPINEIVLDSTDSLNPSDVLQWVSTTSSDSISMTVLDIDNEKSSIILKEPLSGALAANSKLYLDEDSANTILYSNAQDTIITAIKGTADATFTRFTPTVLSIPFLSWLSLKAPLSASSEELITPIDMQVGLSDLRVKGPSTLAWSGSESAWSSTTWTKTVNWTSQRLTAPAYLMPDTTETDLPFVKRENRCYLDWKNRDFNNTDSPTFDTSRADVPLGFYSYDYTTYRRMSVDNTGMKSVVGYKTYNGSVWSANTAITWSTGYIVAAAPLTNTTSSFDAGKGTVAIVGNKLKLIFATVTPADITLTADQQLGVLKQTPYATYLVSEKGYGKIWYDGTLHLSWVTINGVTVNSKDLTDGKVNFLANTFCAYDANTIYCFVAVSYKDSSEKNITETWLYKLTATPDTSTEATVRASVLSREPIYPIAPRQIAAFRDHTGRIVGILGGRLFQINSTISQTIERINAVGLSVADLIEHICQVQCAIAVPNPRGYMEIVSRIDATAAVNHTVSKMSKTRTRVSQYFFSTVRFSAKDEDIYADAGSAETPATGVSGGKVLEFSGHPFVSTRSQCLSLATAYAQFFGYPRRQEEQEWEWSTYTVPSWESITPFQKIKVNGDSQVWYCLGLDIDFYNTRAKATLLEYL